MTDRILTALGAKDEHDALRKIAEASEFMQQINAATGRESYAGALEVIGRAVSLDREVCTVTAKTESGDVLGTILAWKTSHGELPKTSARVTELEEIGRQRDVSALISMAVATGAPTAENPHAGKLTPATAEFWKSEPAEKLSAYLALAPRVIPGEARQAASSSAEVKKNEAGVATDADGNAWEDIAPAKRAQMANEDPELYKALRNDWLSRGEPAPGASAR